MLNAQRVAGSEVKSHKHARKRNVLASCVEALSLAFVAECGGRKVLGYLCYLGGRIATEEMSVDASAALLRFLRVWSDPAWQARRHNFEGRPVRWGSRSSRPPAIVPGLSDWPTTVTLPHLCHNSLMTSWNFLFPERSVPALCRRCVSGVLLLSMSDFQGIAHSELAMATEASALEMPRASSHQ